MLRKKAEAIKKLRQEQTEFKQDTAAFVRSNKKRMPSYEREAKELLAQTRAHFINNAE